MILITVNQLKLLYPYCAFPLNFLVLLFFKLFLETLYSRPPCLSRTLIIWIWKELPATLYSTGILISCLKITSAIKVAPMKIICYKWKPLHVYHKIDTSMVSKDEWDTKEGMKNALCMYSSIAKGTLSGWSNIEQQKNQAHSLSQCRVA